MKSKTALLLGAYGQTNLGDDLLMYNFLNFLTERGHTKVIVNISDSRYIPAVIKDGFANLEFFETYKTSPVAVVKLLSRVDIVVYGGGTVYKELYASTGRSKYSLMLRLIIFNAIAKLQRKPIYNLHIGIGTIKTRFGRFLAKYSLMSAVYTVFRDTTSYHYAQNTLGVPGGSIHSSTDALFIDPTWQRRWEILKLPDHKTSQGLTIGINVLSDIPDKIDREHYIQNVAEFTNALIAEGHQVVFIPFQTDFNPNNDLFFIREEIVPRLARSSGYSIASTVSLTTIISCLQQLDIFIGMRFHSLLLSCVANTPFLAISYDPKCWRFIEESSYGHAIKLEDINKEVLLSAFESLVQDNSVKQTLRRISKTNFGQASKWKESINI